MISWESDCVGCETCINCGRKRKHPVVECDKCHDELDCRKEQKFITISRGVHYCASCYTKKLLDDGEIKECACKECGETEEVYEWDGDFFCRYHLEKEVENSLGSGIDEIAESYREV